MRNLLCVFASLCALCLPAISSAQVAPARAPSARRASRVSRADRTELRRSLAMLSQGPSAPPLPAMRSFVPAGAPSAPTAAMSQARVVSAMRAVERSGLLRRCWQHHLMRNPHEVGRSAVLSLRVDASGQWSGISLDVTDAEPLASCVTLGLRTLSPLPPGDAVETRETITLDRGAP